MTNSARWMIALAVVAVGLIVALGAELSRPGGSGTDGSGTDSSGTLDSTAAESDPARLAEARDRADLPPCLPGPGRGGPESLRGVQVVCAGDGVPVDVATLMAGRRVVLNFWAHWCLPCREELPAMAEYQRRAGSSATVITVHQDDNQTAALALLADLGVRLPTLQDPRRSVSAALRVPNVMPATVVLGTDGTIERRLLKPLTSAAEIAAEIDGATTGAGTGGGDR